MTAPACGHLRVSARDVAELGPRGAAAVMYAATFGLRVVRLRPGRSEPSTPHGVRDATASIPQIRRWFADEPESNAGVAAGNGWLFADLDRKHGDDGPAELAAFMAARGVSLPPVPWARTPSGGVHGWMRVDGEVASRSSGSRIIPGVDLLADPGRYVVVPPSVRLVMPSGHDGERVRPVAIPYTWADGCCPCQAPPAPGWLVEAMRAMPSLGAVNGSPRAAGSGPDGEVDAGQLMARGAPAGQRNGSYYKLACKQYRLHGTTDAGHRLVLADVRQAWQAGETAGMDWGEVLTLVRSARKFITRQEAAERRLLARIARMPL